MPEKVMKAGFETLIFTFRGLKVMIDSDLAQLYDVPTKALKQQVKRNKNRFPEDFMFILNNSEKEELVTNCDRLKSLQHSSVNPMVFTEQGVAMLSTVPNAAIQYLLNRIDELHQGISEPRKAVGYKYNGKPD